MKYKTIVCLALGLIFVCLSIDSTPAYATKTDNLIESSGKKTYVFKTYLKDDDIKIQSKDGVVTLTGKVSEESHKAMAFETISGLPGVKSVDNQLVVTADNANAFSDIWVSERVRVTLLFHRSVSYVDTDVSVKDGVVTLSGTANSVAQKELTTEYAKDVSGVKNVTNNMKIAAAPGKSERLKSEKVDDASITTQVKLSLLYHHGTDGFATTVSTYNGIVTLSGSAKNQAEIDLATKRVNDIHGVESVNNQMHIAVSEVSEE